MNKNDLIIRLETENDYRETETLIREAFWNQSFPGADEHYLVHTMRQHRDFVHELAYVIEYGGQLIGCIMYSKAKLVDESGAEKTVLTMGPLCVHPQYQRKGLSRLLLEHTFEQASELGYDVVINFGNPDNYVARGYKSCLRYNICLEGDIFPAPLLVKELHEGALDGRKWIYSPSDIDAACADTEAVARFDSQFPPKEKAWQPSQEEFFIHSHSILRG